MWKGLAPSHSWASFGSTFFVGVNDVEQIPASVYPGLRRLLAACSPIKVLNALTPNSTFTKTSAIAYGDDPRQNSI